MAAVWPVWFCCMEEENSVSQLFRGYLNFLWRMEIWGPEIWGTAIPFHERRCSVWRCFPSVAWRIPSPCWVPADLLSALFSVWDENKICASVHNWGSFQASLLSLKIQTKNEEKIKGWNIWEIVLPSSITRFLTSLKLNKIHPTEISMCIYKLDGFSWLYSTEATISSF